MILYEVFFRKMIARKKQHILTPIFRPLGEIELPRNALFHYPPADNTEFGIPSDEILIANYSEDIYVNHVGEIKTPFGNPRVRAMSVNADIRAYHNRNRRLKLVRNYTGALNNHRWLFINDYCMANRKLIYRPILFVSYYRWYNMFYTMMEQATNLQKSNRHQFIHLQLPASIPLLNQLNIYEERLNKGLLNTGLEDLSEMSREEFLDYAIESLEDMYNHVDLNETVTADDAASIIAFVNNHTDGNGITGSGLEDLNTQTYGELLSTGLEALKAFESEVMSFKPQLSLTTMNRLRTPADYWFMHLWTWLGQYRQGSLFSMLDHSKLDKINLVISNMGAQIILNLGKIEEWRQEIIAQSDGDINKVNNYRKHLLKMFTKLFSVKTGAVVPVEQDDDSVSFASEETEVVTSTDNSITGSAVVVEEESKEEVEAKKVEVQDLYGISIPTLDESDATETEDDSDDAGTDDKQSPSKKIDDEVQEARGFTDELDDEQFNRDLEQRHNVEVDADKNEPAKPEEGVERYVAKLADSNSLSVAEYKRYMALASKYKTIPATNGKGTIADEMVVKPETLNDIGGMDAPDSVSIIDKGMLKSSTKDLDKKYIDNVLDSDIAGCIMSLQNAGICVLDVKKEEVMDARNHYVVYTVTVQPVGGKQTTIRFRFPKVNEDGIMVVNGVQSRLRKQRVDIPIRKINVSTVALTSYYSKMFLSRSPDAKHNFPNWLCNRIIAMSIPAEEGGTAPVTGLVLGRPFNAKVKVPHAFAILAMRFKRFEFDKYHFNFTTAELVDKFDPEQVERYTNDGLTLCGTNGKHPLLMDKEGNIYTGKGDVLDSEGDIETILGLDTSKAPVETAEIGIFRKRVPVGFLLAYYYGLSEMIRKLGMNVRIVPRGDRLNLGRNERPIFFNDEVIIFNRHDRLTAMLLNGFNNYHKDIVQFSRYDFDRTAVYLNVLTSNGMGVRWTREFELMREMWVDPITAGLLQDMNVPVHFDLLLVHATKMILNDNHLRETSFREQRIRGYERIAGAMYGELVKSVRQQKSRAASTKTGLDLNPDAVWFKILGDTSSSAVEECNPVHNIKEVEVVTFGGTGGRTSRSVTKPNREFIEDNMGVMSEHTVDNADVAYTGYLSMDPNISNLRGLTYPATEDTPATKIVSTSALLNPGADRDDAKRTNFIGIQHSQAMYAFGYQTTPYRTGGERMLAHRVTKMFAYAAEADGEIVELSDKHMTVDYGEFISTVELGARFGSASGTVYIHRIITDLSVGFKFKRGHILAWNRNYFERDFMDPTQVSWKAGAMVHIFLKEDQYTFEDSGVITRRVAERLATETVKISAIKVGFTQEVRNLLPVGTEVEMDDILCIVENQTTANIAGLDEEADDGLRLMASPGHKSKVSGKIVKIDITYRGELDNMSESLSIIANRCNKERARMNKRLHRKASDTCAVREDLRVGGKTLESNEAIIEIYITVPQPTIRGDKGVMTNQMKFTFGDIVEDDLVTLSGLVLGGKFSNKGIANRMVNSPYICGVMNHYLFTVTRNAIRMYRELNK